MTQRTLHLHGRHTSYNVQKVLWLLDELKLDYTHSQIGGRFGGNDSAEFLAMNPRGKVPVLQHGERIIWESNTIVRYLAQTFPVGSWMSQEAYQRSTQERWMDWSIDQLEPAFVGVFWGYFRTAPEQRNPAAISSSVDACEACLQLLNNELSTKHYLTGDTPTIADIATGVFLHRLIEIDLEVSIPVHVMSWYKELSQRSAYARWVMSDFEELRGRSGY